MAYDTGLHLENTTFKSRSITYNNRKCLQWMYIFFLFYIYRLHSTSLQRRNNAMFWFAGDYGERQKSSNTFEEY